MSSTSDRPGKRPGKRPSPIIDLEANEVSRDQSTTPETDGPGEVSARFEAPSTSRRADNGDLPPASVLADDPAPITPTYDEDGDAVRPADTAGTPAVDALDPATDDAGDRPASADTSIFGETAHLPTDEEQRADRAPETIEEPAARDGNDETSADAQRFSWRSGQEAPAATFEASEAARQAETDGSTDSGAASSLETDEDRRRARDEADARPVEERDSVAAAPVMAPPPARSGAGFGSLLLAAILGALLAGSGLWLAMRATGSDGPGTGLAATVDGGEIDAATIEAMNQRLAALEQGPAAGGADQPGLRDDVTALAGRVQEAETALAALRDQVAANPSGSGTSGATVDLAPVNARIDELAGRLEQATSRLAAGGQAEQSAPAAPAVDPAAVEANRQLAEQARATADQARTATETLAGRIEQEIGAVERSVGERATALQAVEGEVASLKSELQSLQGAVAEEAKRREDVVKAQADSERIARSVAVAALKGAYEGGDSLDLPLASLETLTGGTEATARLKALGAEGLPSNAQLAEQLSDVAPAILTAGEPQARGMMDQLMQNARQLVRVRPSGPLEGDTREARLSRIEAALRSGDIAAALSEWQGLPEVARQASAPFGAALERRAEADRLVAGLVAEPTAEQ